MGVQQLSSGGLVAAVIIIVEDTGVDTMVPLGMEVHGVVALGVGPLDADTCAMAVAVATTRVATAAQLLTEVALGVEHCAVPLHDFAGSSPKTSSELSVCP